MTLTELEKAWPNNPSIKRFFEVYKTFEGQHGKMQAKTGHAF